MPYSPPTWQCHTEQLLLRNTAMILGIKHIDITPAEFRFYFIAKMTDQHDLQFAASATIDDASLLGRIKTIVAEYRSEYSSLSLNAIVSGIQWVYRRAASGDLKVTEWALETTTQQLGTIDGWTVGVVHCERTNRANQEITLHVTFSESQTWLWQFSPLRQLRWQPHRESTREDESIPQEILPVIEWQGPLRRERVGYFVNRTRRQKPEKATYIFVRLDHPSNVTVITRSKYIAITHDTNL